VLGPQASRGYRYVPNKGFGESKSPAKTAGRATRREIDEVEKVFIL